MYQDFSMSRDTRARVFLGGATTLMNSVIDLSHYNTVQSFQMVKDSGILGVIHKATEGTGFVDALYNEHRKEAISAGLLWGAYHVGIQKDVRGQVNHFLDVVRPGPTDLMVLDFEPNSREGTMTLAEAEFFVEYTNERIARFPGLYSGQAFILDQLGNTLKTPLQNCFLWIARYSVHLPQLPPAFTKFTFWQYTDGSGGPKPHQVPGIGRCDRDKFNGGEKELGVLWGFKRKVG
jgi:lysozyme